MSSLLSEADIISLHEEQVQFINKLLREFGSSGSSGPDSPTAPSSEIPAQTLAIFAIRRWLRFVLLLHEGDKLWPYFTSTDVGVRVWPRRARKCWKRIQQHQISVLCAAIAKALDADDGTLHVTLGGDGSDPAMEAVEQLRKLICHLIGATMPQDEQVDSMQVDCSLFIVDPADRLAGDQLVTFTPMCHKFVTRHLSDELSTIFLTPTEVQDFKEDEVPTERAPRVQGQVKQLVPLKAKKGDRSQCSTIPRNPLPLPKRGVPALVDRVAKVERPATATASDLTVARQIPLRPTSEESVPNARPSGLRPPMIQNDYFHWAVVANKRKLRPLKPRAKEKPIQVRSILRRPSEINQFPRLPSRATLAPKEDPEQDTTHAPSPSLMEVPSVYNYTYPTYSKCNGTILSVLPNSYMPALWISLALVLSFLAASSRAGWI